MRWLVLLLAISSAFAEPPEAEIINPPFDSVASVGTEVALFAFVNDPSATVTWTLSNGETLTGNSPSFVLADGDPLVITMIAENADGERSEPDTRIVYPNAPADFLNMPSVEQVASSRTTVNPGDPIDLSVEFTDPDADGPYTFRWFWLEDKRPVRRTGESLSAVRLPLNQIGQESYLISVIIQDSAGNYGIPGFVTVSVREGNLPPSGRIVSPASSNITVLRGSTLTFQAEAEDPEGDTPVTISWISPDFEFVDGNPIDFQFNELGSFVVVLRLSDGLGNLENSADSTIITVVDELPAPESFILFPRGDTRVFAGDQVFLSGTVIGDGFPTWSFVNPESGQNVLSFSGDEQPGRVFAPPPGLYRLNFFAEENGLQTLESLSSARWLTVAARDGNRPPVLNYVDGTSTHFVKNGGSIDLSVAVSDPDQDAVRLFWVENGRFLGEGEATRRFEFNIDPEEFFQGTKFASYNTHALDSRGRAPDFPLYQNVIVYEDKRPPRTFINDFPAAATIFQPVNQPLNVEAVVDNPENLDLTYIWSGRYLGSLESIFSSDQRLPDPLVPDQLGVISLSVRSLTFDGTVADPLGSIIYVYVFDPDQTPTVEITEPAAETVRTEPGEPIVLNGLFSEPNFADTPFSDLNFLEQITNTLIWDVQGPEGFSQSFEQNDPVNLTLNTPGEYSVQLRARNNLGLESAVADNLTITVEAPAGDAALEPNDTRETAAVLPAGKLSGLSVDDADPVDWYRFDVGSEGLSLRWNLDLREADADLVLELFREENLVQSSTIKAGRLHPFVFVDTSPGTYFLRLASAAPGASKTGLNFSIAVDVLQPRLVFPYTKTDEVEETLLTLVNPTGEAADATLIARSEDGENLAEISLALNARGHTERSIESLFPTVNPLDIVWVQVLSDRAIQGLSTTLGRDGATGIAEPALIGGLNELIIPHIAIDTDNWFTRAAIANSSGETVSASLEAPGGTFDLSDISEVNNGTVIDFETFFGGTIDADNEWGRLVESNAKPSLSGMELFGTKSGNPRLAALSLTSENQANPNFIFSSKDIIFPHVATDTATFWTGIAFVNISDASFDVVLRAYSTTGRLLGEKLINLAPFEKRVGLAPSFFDDLDESEPLAWIALRSDGPVSGYELFGDFGTNERPSDRLAGLQAVRGASTSLTFPKIQVEAGELWTGIAVVNLSPDDTANLTYRAYNADGDLLAEITGRSIAPFRKEVALVETIFGGTLPEGTCWVRLESSQPIAGFALFGNLTNRFMAGALAR